MSKTFFVKWMLAERIKKKGKVIIMRKSFKQGLRGLCCMVLVGARLAAPVNSSYVYGYGVPAYR